MLLKKYTGFLLLLTLVFAASSCSRTNTAQRAEKTQQDSIAVWIQQAKDTTAPEKLPLLQKAYRIAATLAEDTIKAKHLLALSYEYLDMKDTMVFRKVNKEAMQLTTTLKDSSGLAGACWDLAYYLSDRHKPDSAYYYYAKAQRLYEKLNNDFSSARMLLNMGIKQIHIGDHVGSEVTTKKAIALLKSLKKYSQLYSCYNNLGIIYKEIGNYDEALKYHNTALDYLRKTNGANRSEPITLNNIGLVYKNQEKYTEAIAKYREALYKNNLYAKDPAREATIIDNMAYARFKRGDTVDLSKQFYEALKIRDSINDVPGIALSKLHLAEYYAVYKDTVKALKYAYEARALIVSSKYLDELLESLLLLSKLEKGEKSIAHLNAYIKLNDSLERVAFALRVNYDRIRFETASWP